jgi:ATP-dependent RNA helicase DOB1
LTLLTFFKFFKAEEKKLVDEVFQNAMMVLSEEDRALPQVENVLPLLKRGIGIHHGGLLPILKETTEILFGEGLIKALFATETFAMGLNMPARTVVFTAAQKFDGKDMRWLTSGEYIQMSGRAGRRGMDERGIVILMVDDKMNPAIGRELVKGASDNLNSAFHLTYNMVLNLLRVEEVNPEYMMERSFHQFQNYSNIPKLYQSKFFFREIIIIVMFSRNFCKLYFYFSSEVKDLEQNISGSKIRDEAEVTSYYRLREQLTNLSAQFQSWLVKPQYLVPFLQPGRLVSVKHGDKDFGFGAVVSFKKKGLKEKDNPMEEDCSYVIDVLLYVTSETSKSQSTLNLMPVPKNEKGVMVVVPIHPSLIQQISSVRIFIPKDIRPSDNRKAVYKSIEQVQVRFGDNVPLLDPVKDMKIGDKSFKEIVKKIDTFEQRLALHSLHNNPDLPGFLNSYGKKAALMKQLDESKAELKKAKSLLQMSDLKCMKRVLRRMGYCTPADVIEVKGRIACELSSADELLLTEMMFNGLFNDLEPAQAASILSCFVCDERSNEMPKLTGDLSGPLRTMQDMAKRIATVSKEAKIEIDEELYVQKFKPFMMDVVFEWCKGASFMQICKMTDLFEGKISVLLTILLISCTY